MLFCQDAALSLVEWICVAILHLNRLHLLTCDMSDALGFLLRHSQSGHFLDVDMWEIVILAISLRDRVSK